MNQSECPGARTMDFRQKDEELLKENGKRESQLRQWPIQFYIATISL